MIINIAGEDIDCGMVSLHCEDIGKVDKIGDNERIAKITFKDYDELMAFSNVLYNMRIKIEENILKDAE